MESRSAQRDRVIFDRGTHAKLRAHDVTLKEQAAEISAHDVTLKEHSGEIRKVQGHLATVDLYQKTFEHQIKIFRNTMNEEFRRLREAIIHGG